MLESINSFFQNLGGQKNLYDENDPRVATVALLFYIIDANGGEKVAEKNLLKKIVGREYELAENDLKELIIAAQFAYNDSIDLMALTSTLKRHLNENERIAFIGLLWEIAFADGQVHELEDNLIWRIAELVGVEQKDRLELKKQVAQRLRLEPITA